MLKFVYSLFLGILLVIFVGMGVASFYPGPEAPEYPAITSDKSEADTAKVEEEYRKKSDAYNTSYQDYSRNVSIVVLIAALVLLVVSLGMHTKISVLADGLLIGGTLTLIYSIIRGVVSQNPRYTFGVVSVGIAITLIVGYLKFVKPATAAAGKKK